MVSLRGSYQMRQHWIGPFKCIQRIQNSKWYKLFFWQCALRIDHLPLLISATKFFRFAIQCVFRLALNALCHLVAAGRFAFRFAYENWNSFLALVGFLFRSVGDISDAKIFQWSFNAIAAGRSSPDYHKIYTQSKHSIDKWQIVHKTEAHVFTWARDEFMKKWNAILTRMRGAHLFKMLIA